MAARLPKPGSDEGTWGDILNEYLSVSHQQDGKLKPGTIPNGSITPAKLNSDTPVNGEVLSYNAGAFEWVTPAASGGSGEANTASNIGTGGVGVYKQKTGVDFELKRIRAGSNKVTITDNTGNNTIDLDVAPANLGLTKADVGLSNVDNTSDLNKPIATATQTALNGKANTTHTHAAADITSGTIATARLGSGTANTTTYLRGDGAWVAPGGEVSSDIETEVLFSSLGGANDDAKLASFMTTYSGSTFKGTTLVLDEARDYTFTQQQTLYSGFSIRGPFRPQDQPRGSMPIGNRIRLRMSGGAKGWFRLPSSPSSIFGLSFSNLSIDGDANSRLLDGHASTVLWTSVFRDISIQNALGVLGSTSQKLLVTACTVDGWWNVNNVQERAFNLGGSDFYFSPSTMLLDSPLELLGPTEYLMSHEALSNSWTSNVYITAEGHSALSLSGGSGSVSNWVKDCVIEGRNADAPSPGALVRMTGGQYMVRDTRFGFAMANPPATGRNDQGTIHITGGNLVIDGATYQRANGVAETVPFLYASGGKVRIRNIVGVGSWVGKPVVKQAVAGLIDADDSVTVVTPGQAQVVGTASTGATNAGTSLMITAPASMADGDLLVAAVYNRNGTATYATPPSGWVEAAPNPDDTAAGAVRIYTKQITSAGTEPASYTWAGGASGRHAGVITRVTGAATSSLINVRGAAATLIGGPDRIILPSVTTTTTNTLLIGVCAGSANPTVSFGSGTMTTIATASTTTGATESSLTMLVEVAGGSGATGTRLCPSSGSTSSGVGYMVAIRSAD